MDSEWNLCNGCLFSLTQAAECLLTEGKASVDIPGGPDLETALHEAVFNRQVAVVRLLLNHHANPNFPNGKGVSPLQVSAERVAETQNEVLKTANKIPKGRRHKQHNSLEAMKDFQAIKDLLESAVAKMERNTITVLDTSESAAALFIERWVYAIWLSVLINLWFFNVS